MTDTTGAPAEPTAAQISPVEVVGPWTMTDQPAGQPTEPADPWAVSDDVVAADVAARPGRKARLRWIVAAAVLLVTGTAATFAVLLPQRTDLPGLHTPDDGRYAFPQLTLPSLPAGKPAPDDKSRLRHYADLRALVLPAPKGVTVPPANWVPCTDYTALFSDKDGAGTTLTENACRAATHRTWTAADGTRTDIWLLRFGSEGEARTFYHQMSVFGLKDIPSLHSNADIDESLTPTSQVQAADPAPGGNQPTARVMTASSGDIAYTVVMTNPKGVLSQAFRQVTLLQSEMLN